jgi:tetratricopeptide (TPR) repeat protein
MKTKLVRTARETAGTRGLARTCCNLILLLAGLCIAAVASAEDLESRFAAADQAASEQRLEDMQQIYESILAANPDNARAQRGKATALAWQRKFTEAQSAYRRSLSLNPNDVEAMVGLGYAYAWNGEYTHAHTVFNQALNVDPMHLGARKGIGYSYLWSGQTQLALETFDIAASIAPSDAENWEAKSRAHLLAGRNRDAIADIDKALAIQPDRHGMQALRIEAFRTAPAFELNASAGTTSGAGNGLRNLEVAHWINRSTRLALRYDNSLGLDNAAIFDRGEVAEGYFAGASHRFDRGITAILELGQRRLTDGDQTFATLQTVIETQRGAVRLGTQFGDHESGYTDKLFFGGFNFPVASNWRIEPVLFVSETGAAADSEWRAVLNAERRWDIKLSTGVFAGAGQIDAQLPEFDGSTQLFGGWLRYEPAGRTAVTLSLRRESTPSQDISVFEVGFTIRLPGNGGR